MISETGFATPSSVGSGRMEVSNLGAELAALRIAMQLLPQQIAQMLPHQVLTQPTDAGQHAISAGCSKPFDLEHRVQWLEMSFSNFQQQVFQELANLENRKANKRLGRRERQNEITPSSNIHAPSSTGMLDNKEIRRLHVAPEVSRPPFEGDTFIEHSQYEACGNGGDMDWIDVGNSSVPLQTKPFVTLPRDEVSFINLGMHAVASEPTIISMKLREEETEAAAARLTAEQAAKVEANRLAVEEAAKIKRERLAAEQAAKAEADRLEIEETAKVERERLAAEQAARAEVRLAAEEAAKVKNERLAAEQAAEAQADRLAAEEAVKIKTERLAAEQAAKAETDRLAAEEAAKVKDARLAAEQAAKAEADRLAAEEAAKVKGARLVAEKAAKAEADRLAAEEAAKIKTERLAAEQAAKAEADRLAAEEAAKVKDARLVAEKAAKADEAAPLAAEEEAAKSEACDRQVAFSNTLLGIQGRWQDAYGTRYLIRTHEAIVTLREGQSASFTLSEKPSEDQVWWCDRWWINTASVTGSQKTGQLRWSPANLADKPLIWWWID